MAIARRPYTPGCRPNTENPSTGPTSHKSIVIYRWQFEKLGPGKGSIETALLGPTCAVGFAPSCYHEVMNRALWRRAIADAWLQLVASMVVLLAFGWVFVWLMSTLPKAAVSTLLQFVLEFIKAALPVPVADLASPKGQLTFPFVHAITFLVCLGWALGRGSTISAEINRGTGDLLFTLPVRRASVLLAPAVVAALGAAAIAASLWGGIALGLLTVDLAPGVSPLYYLPGAVNLFALMLCLIGLTNLVSALSCDRWRTIIVTGAIFVLASGIDLVRLIWRDGWWLNYCTFMSAYRPQELTLKHPPWGWMAVACNGSLAALGLVMLLAAAVIVARRDIPQPR